MMLALRMVEELAERSTEPRFALARASDLYGVDDRRLAAVWQEKRRRCRGARAALQSQRKASSRDSA